MSPLHPGDKRCKLKGTDRPPSVLIVYVRSSLHACFGFLRLSRPYNLNVIYTLKSSAFGNSHIWLSMCYVEIDCILILTLILFFVFLFFLFCFVLVCFICLSVEFA